VSQARVLDATQTGGAICARGSSNRNEAEDVRFVGCARGVAIGGYGR
jgi:hypothetical protein